MSGTLGSQKTVSDSPDLESQAVVSLYGCWKQTGSSARAGSSKTTEASLQSPFPIFNTILIQTVISIHGKLKQIKFFCWYQDYGNFYIKVKNCSHIEEENLL